MGRPSKYSEEITLTICTRIAEGESLNRICKDAKMPTMRTVLSWLTEEDKAEFLHKYTRAREAQADRMAEEILEIADTPQIGVKTKTSDGKTEITEGDMIEHRRLQVDARKWLAARLAPKKYGDRMAVDANHTGGLTVEIVKFSPGK